MRYTGLISLIMLLTLTPPVMAQRSARQLKQGWNFAKGDINTNTSWQKITVPHDWATEGPFDKEIDKQVVAIEQNGETVPTEKHGRTGSLPFIGKGTYRNTISIPDTAGRSFTLLFDGAMSRPVVTLNGIEVGRWSYGYNAFEVCLDSAVRPGDNLLEVSLENLQGQSRWYPGAGLYRNVTLIETSKTHIPVWGTYITTPEVSDREATVKICTSIAGAKQGTRLSISTSVIAPDGKTVASQTYPYVANGQDFIEYINVNDPQLWSPESPSLYTARTTVSDRDGKVLDVYDTRFGIRKIEYIADKGFFLNGKLTKFKGVCNHHDLGPLGAAVNTAALRRQLTMLKDMGANAIRTSHNMPAQELVELADEMGFMLMVEAFDDWAFQPKSPNGYGTMYGEWAEKDVTNMVRHFRNNPSVVMWSVGNEVTSQHDRENGVKDLVFLQDIVHREDPTRPVTVGINELDQAMDNGFAAAVDIPGFNYKPQHYRRIIKDLPQKLILGSETASTVSSRGVYHFPVELAASAMFPDNQVSSYDVDYCFWSNIPEPDFAADEDLPYVIGQFVWTGFDYLGEPTPYDIWPNHSSNFGIIDLASIPKDRYYLYRSVWNTSDTTLHILPHWTWPDRKGKVTPVFVYTSWPKAELFINGISQGMREKNDSTEMTRYRLMWNDVVYKPGEIKVVAYDADGKKAGEKTVRTAGKAHHLVLTPDRTSMQADGEDLIYVTVQIADRNGTILPTDSREVKFDVTGAATFRATANGDPKSIRPFQRPEMDLFSGACTVILRASDTPGTATLTVTARGLRPATIDIPVTARQ